MSRQGEIPPIGGVINLYKDRGQSSFSLVSRARRALGVRKIGFDGTLDPFAEGVLPLYIGRACNALPYVEDESKEYVSLLAFGASSDSLDATGRLTESRAVGAREEAALLAHEAAQVREALRSFLGEREQAIPQVSAAKYRGRRFVDLLREGKSPPARTKKITVLDAEVLGAWPRGEGAAARKAYISYRGGREMQSGLEDRAEGESYISEQTARQAAEIRDQELGPFFLLRHEVSRGSYIRQLNADLAAQCGQIGLTVELLRSRHGIFRSTDAVNLPSFVKWAEKEGRRLLSEARHDALLRAADDPLQKYPVLKLETKHCQDLLQGKSVSLPEDGDSEILFRLYCGERFLGLVRREHGLWRAERMFLSVEDF